MGQMVALLWADAWQHLTLPLETSDGQMRQILGLGLKFDYPDDASRIAELI